MILPTSLLLSLLVPGAHAEDAAPAPAPAPDPATEELRLRIRQLEADMDSMRVDAPAAGLAPKELPLDLETKVHGFADVSLFSYEGSPVAFSLGALVLDYQANLGRKVYFSSEFAYEIFGQSWGLDIEEVKISAGPGPEFQVEAGRFHTPLSTWAQSALHGSYRYTPVDLPEVLALEDEGGSLPMHLVGVGVNGLVPVGFWQVRYHASVSNGRSPVLGQVAQTSDTDLAKALLAGIWLTSPGGIELGAAGYYDAIEPGTLEGEGVLPERTTEAIGTVHVSSTGKVELLAEGFLVHHAAKTEALNLSGYAQLGVKFGKVTPFVRVERLEQKLEDPLFAAMGSVGNENKASFGARWDFSMHAALKAQVNLTDEHEADNLDESEQHLGAQVQLAAGF